MGIHADFLVRVAPMSHDNVVHGDYVPPEVKAQFDSLRTVFDAKASLDRIDSYAKWIFASSTIVGALGAGLSNGAMEKAHGLSLFLFTAAVVCLGVSLVAACQSITPQLESVRLNDLDSMRNAVNNHFKQRQRYVTVAAWSYSGAILLAAMVPLLSVLTMESSARLTYSIDSKSSLTADVHASGMKKGTDIELDIDGQSGHLSRGSVNADSSGEGAIHLGPIVLDPAKTATIIVEKKNASGDSNWEELQRVSIQP
jgi:hypothetical protein